MKSNMKSKMLLMITSFFLSLNTMADHSHATQMFTPTLWAQKPDYFACNLTNVSDKTRTVQVRIISNGTILQDSGKVDVEPLHTANYYLEGLGDRGGPLFCEFTIEGPKKWYRGSAKLFPSENSPTTDTVAIPAE